jgi:lipoate-protein ligase A
MLKKNKNKAESGTLQEFRLKRGAISKRVDDGNGKVTRKVIKPGQIFKDTMERQASNLKTGRVVLTAVEKAQAKALETQKKAIAEINAKVTEVAQSDEEDMSYAEFKELTVEQMKTVAAEEGVDLTGLTKEKDIFTTLAKEFYPEEFKADDK